MPYLDGARQLAYQGAWMLRRRAEWVAKMGGRCSACGADGKLEIVGADPARRRGMWSRRPEVLAEILRSAVLFCGAHAREHHRARLAAPRVLERDHGTVTRYKTGCRCEACRDAYKARRRTWASFGREAADLCRWCGRRGATLAGRGESSGDRFHPECRVAAELLHGWDLRVATAV